MKKTSNALALAHCLFCYKRIVFFKKENCREKQ